ncbi:MAG: hypothetical protein IJY22_04395 [Clostridia bacterium]|nr:hypothetical protein [Clostridia bacterium]
MKEICELIMLICFGLSWPISVYKSIRSGSTKGKSAVFIVAIIVGYIAGITGKIVGGQLSYVLVLYVLNLVMVSFDLILYFINRHREKAATGGAS